MKGSDVREAQIQLQLQPSRKRSFFGEAANINLIIHDTFQPNFTSYHYINVDLSYAESHSVYGHLRLSQTGTFNLHDSWNNPIIKLLKLKF